MLPASLDFKRDGFGEAISASVNSIGVEPDNTIVYSIRDETGSIASIGISPYRKSVDVQIGELASYVLYDVGRVALYEYRNADGVSVLEIRFGPGLIVEGGSDRIYLHLSVKPTITSFLSSQVDEQELADKIVSY